MKKVPSGSCNVQVCVWSGGAGEFFVNPKAWGRYVPVYHLPIFIYSTGT